MGRALGMVEYKTVSTGIVATDRMVKSAELKLIFAQVVCPGKYIAMVEGELSAIRIAVDTAKNMYGDTMIGSFVLGNPHGDIFSAMYGTTKVNKVQALGIFETFDAATCIEAADHALKAAEIDIIELRIAKGMCGKSYFTITGSVACVSAAVERAMQHAKSSGMLLDSQVIAQADEQIARSILGNLQ